MVINYMRLLNTHRHRLKITTIVLFFLAKQTNFRCFLSFHIIDCSINCSWKCATRIAFFTCGSNSWSNGEMGTWGGTAKWIKWAASSWFRGGECTKLEIWANGHACISGTVCSACVRWKSLMCVKWAWWYGSMCGALRNDNGALCTSAGPKLNKPASLVATAAIKQMNYKKNFANFYWIQFFFTLLPLLQIPNFQQKKFQLLRPKFYFFQRNRQIEGRKNTEIEISVDALNQAHCHTQNELNEWNHILTYQKLHVSPTKSRFELNQSVDGRMCFAFFRPFGQVFIRAIAIPTRISCIYRWLLSHTNFGKKKNSQERRKWCMRHSNVANSFIRAAFNVFPMINEYKWFDGIQWNVDWTTWTNFINKFLHMQTIWICILNAYRLVVVYTSPALFNLSKTWIKLCA